MLSKKGFGVEEVPSFRGGGISEMDKSVPASKTGKTPEYMYNKKNKEDFSLIRKAMYHEILRQRRPNIIYIHEPPGCNGGIS